ncbi:FkbM family methyltransferase [Aestuariivivens marinum]|uniref:FkbM family methyltransferase n=1 Tax=Aestuariivivens marinum TaxID=2913555 RepID=UPI001F595244|nr:FkbM family methyltransferase [Aestuariivivens marinum]
MKQQLAKIYTILPHSIKSLLRSNPIFKRLGRLLLMSKGAYPETFIWVKKKYGNYSSEFKFYTDLNIALKVQKQGMETTLLNRSLQLAQRLKPNKNDLTVLDIGANFGYLSLVWAQTIAKQGTIYAFEPNSKVFSSFCKSITANAMEGIIKVKNNAVGMKNGTVELFLNSTTSNVLSPLGPQSLKKPLCTTIEMVNIDTFVKAQSLSACDFIKIDVDGIELDILEGGIETLKKFKPTYVVETNNDTHIINFFKLHGYTVMDMNLAEYKINTPLPPNVFCVPN